MQFSNNTSKAPHIDLSVIAHAQYDLWCSIVPALYIGVDGFVLETAGAEINDTNAGFVGLFQ